MGIRLDPEQADAQGLPVVTWEEDRNQFAPEGPGPARVACFIRPDTETGVLQFVAAGSVRHGSFEEARPWEALKSFEKGIGGPALPFGLGSRCARSAREQKQKRRGPPSGNGRRACHARQLHRRARKRRDAFELRRRDFHGYRAVARSVAAGIHRQAPASHRTSYATANISGRRTNLLLAFQPPAPAVVPRWKARLVDLSIAVVLALIGWGFYEFLCAKECG